MLRWCAASLDVARPFQPQEEPATARALEIFSWMMCGAMGMNPLWCSALIEGGVPIIVITRKMPVSSAQVFWALFPLYKCFEGIPVTLTDDRSLRNYPIEQISLSEPFG